MSGFLHTLARLAVGEVTTVRPRSRTRFEPVEGPVLGLYAVTDRQPGPVTAHLPINPGGVDGLLRGHPAMAGTGTTEPRAVSPSPLSTPSVLPPAGLRQPPLTAHGQERHAGGMLASDVQGGNPVVETASVASRGASSQAGTAHPDHPAAAPGIRPRRPAGPAYGQEAHAQPTPLADPLRRAQPVAATSVAVAARRTTRPVVSRPEVVFDQGPTPDGPDGPDGLDGLDGRDGSEGSERPHETEGRAQGSAVAADEERFRARPGSVGHRPPPPPPPPASRAAIIPADDTARTEPSPSPPPVVVSVGRIEIQAVTRPAPPPAPVAPRERTSTAPALDQYLARLEGGA